MTDQISLFSTPQLRSPLGVAIPDLLQPAVDLLYQQLLDKAAAQQLELPTDAAWQSHCRSIFACSEFIAQTCLKTPALLLDLWQSGDLSRCFDRSDYTERVTAQLDSLQDDDLLLMIKLRQFRNREMVRIAWRDLAGWSDTGETLLDLTHLAEAAVAVTLERLHEWHCDKWGTPRSSDGSAQQLMVLGMGKLGGGELNYSSDIDLIFVYPEEGETDSRRPLANSQYFVRLGQRLIRVFDQVTGDGFVFRVDMRLRPFGESGPLVVSLSGLEAYCITQAREWERYAMIKARIIAGDGTADADELRALLKPFVYRRYLDYGAFASLREMKEMINREVERKGLKGNIKLGAGGIREIEFIGQAFQLVRGGSEPSLQQRPILQVLEALEAGGFLPAEVVMELSQAYDFHRRLENRLQMVADKQTHLLPQSEAEQARIAYAMGYADWAVLAVDIEQHTTRVHHHFAQIFRAAEDQEGAEEDQGLVSLWQGALSREMAETLLDNLGFDNGAELVERLQQLRSGTLYNALTTLGRKRLDQLMPLLLAAVAKVKQSADVLPRLLTLVQAIARRSVYLALLVENPGALEQLVRLCAASPWVAAFITRHPILLDELLDPRSLYELPDIPSLKEEVALMMARVDEGDLERQMEVMRHFKNINVLRVAAVDLSGQLPLMQVSDHLTWIAEVVLEQVYSLIWQQLAQKHGRPSAKFDGDLIYPQMGIIAYGKLGGIELGYGSDLDVVFLHDSHGTEQQTDGDNSIENNLFFIRLAQKLMHFLNAATVGGMLYEVDVRLRPNGNSGLLVSTLEAFESYQRNEAWTWEHQALVRARVVVGSERLCRHFVAIRRSILGQQREAQPLQIEVREMRERMRSELGSGKADFFDIKQDQGGVADIEFMVQYAVLAGAYYYPALLTYTDNMRILQSLADTGLLSVEDAGAMAEAYRLYRSEIHRCALAERKARIPLTPRLQTLRETITRLWLEQMVG